MKIVIVNKFLYKKGGAEVYAYKLGRYFENKGHEVQYFGMDSKERCMGNSSGQYVSSLDFVNGSKFKKLTYPFKIIYSIEARRKIAKLLDDFKPDIVHLNNINYQLTPSIIYEIKKHKIPIVQTVHDAQIVCPNHKLYVEERRKICEKCIDGKYFNCIKEKCVHNSKAESIIAAIESYYYHFRKTYDLIDRFICPSEFIAEKISHAEINKDKTTVICNFTDNIDEVAKKNSEKYVIYFGRVVIEKGIETLLQACKDLHNVNFVIAGSGPLEEKVKGLSNVKYVGFKSGKELQDLIAGAYFSVYPSEWYENCPLSVIESQNLGTPVLGSDLGGTQELIIEGKTGEIFKAGDVNDLEKKIQKLWNEPKYLEYMRTECLKNSQNSIDKYYEKLIEIYKDVIENRGM